MQIHHAGRGTGTASAGYCGDSGTSESGETEADLSGSVMIEEIKVTVKCDQCGMESCYWFYEIGQLSELNAFMTSEGFTFTDTKQICGICSKGKS